MKMNWILRLQNKTTLTTLCIAIITAIYGIFAAVGFVPSITQEQATNLILTFIGIATSIGIVVDPSTKGFSDSNRVMGYNKPYSDEIDG